MNYKEWIDAALPRTTKALNEGQPWYSPRVGISSILDQASLPGRAYASIGRPKGETYREALARTGPTMSMQRYQGEGDEFADAVLRDPTLPLGVVAAGMANPLGRAGMALFDAATGASAGMADQYSKGEQITPGAALLSAGMNAVPSVVGGHGPRRVGITPDELTPRGVKKNSQFWSENQSEAIMERYGKNGIPRQFLDARERGKELKKWMNENNKSLTEAIYSLPDEATGLDLDQYSVAELFFSSGFEGKPAPILSRGWRYGEPTHQGSSYNFAEQRAEPGVSLMEAFTDENPNVIGGTYQKFNASENPVIVEGWMLDKYGSDGEPLMRGAKVIGRYPNENIKYFTGGKSAIPQTSRIQRKAQEAAVRKYLSPEEKKRAQAVDAMFGGLIQSPGDTYYTRGSR